MVRRVADTQSHPEPNRQRARKMKTVDDTPSSNPIGLSFWLYWLPKRTKPPANDPAYTPHWPPAS